MYSPAYAIQTDDEENKTIIHNHPFATIVYSIKEMPQSFHLPLVLEDNKLIGHMAKANPAWKDLDGICALFIFHGPHHYISPEFYGTEGNVPTWNYVSVQVRGKVIIRNEEAYLKKALLKLSRKMDPAFDIEKNISSHQDLLSGIVGLEIDVQEIFGKFKLAQSKGVPERENVIKALEGIDSDEARATAKAMKKTIRSYR